MSSPITLLLLSPEISGGIRASRLKASQTPPPARRGVATHEAAPLSDSPPDGTDNLPPSPPSPSPSLLSPGPGTDTDNNHAAVQDLNHSHFIILSYPPSHVHPHPRI
ncbi:uncharacterized protein EDB93DRAFT_1253552 [Suillus bovinus]|uniref:uncharacterized protein n=1 Tax=Suillus bovinus TaxID=48563 RepID=UPI001B86D6A1|nr:uncharacterized protein EDB93DRAFT_1253552 [Suillus bovinus]KAG2137898.1 hypothetical protein EDB93DRAFT_1253552 [Suillus bovinus]